MNQNADRNEPPLPVELTNVIDRIRHQVAAPERVAVAISKAVALNGAMNPSLRKVRKYRASWQLATSIAAAVVVALSIGIWTSELAIDAVHPVRLPSDVVSSNVAKSSLVLVGYRRVDEDMDLAVVKTVELSAALELAALRREIRATLDEYYDWSDRK